MQVGQEKGTETLRIVYQFRSSCLKVLHEKYLFSKFLKVFTKTPVVGSCFSKTARSVTVLKQDSTAVVFLGIFQNLPNSHSITYNSSSVICLYLRRYLHIFLIHFHLSHSKSYRCSQMYIIFEICYITLLLSFCFTCRLEIM